VVESATTLNSVPNLTGEPVATRGAFRSATVSLSRGPGKCNGAGLLPGVSHGVFTHRYSAAVWLAIYMALQIGANFVSPPVRSFSAVLALVLVSAALFTFLALAAFASLTAAVQRRATAALMLGIGVAGLVVLREVSSPVARGAGALAVLVYAVRELCCVLGAVGFGILLASAIPDRNILLPAAVFAAFADFIVVRYAPSTVHWALNSGAKGQQALNAMSAHVPALHPGLPVLTIGFLDFFFLSIFFACVHRFHLRLGATFLALLVFVTLSLWFVPLTGAAIPGLVPIALAFVLANFRCFKLSREELQAMGAAAAIVLIAALFIMLRQPHASHPAPAPAKASEGRTAVLYLASGDLRSGAAPGEARHFGGARE
jgi:hypothetical protein